jgi:hypothetical protein
MQEKHNCNNCETEYTVRWIPLTEDEEDDNEIGFPIFCPFCGHELELDDLEE